MKGKHQILNYCNYLQLLKQMYGTFRVMIFLSIYRSKMCYCWDIFQNITYNTFLVIIIHEIFAQSSIFLKLQVLRKIYTLSKVTLWTGKKKKMYDLPNHAFGNCCVKFYFLAIHYQGKKCWKERLAFRAVTNNSKL